MITPRISADWCATNLITAFSGTPPVQEVYTIAEVVHLTTGLLRQLVLFNFTHRKCVTKSMINR